MMTLFNNMLRDHRISFSETLLSEDQTVSRLPREQASTSSNSTWISSNCSRSRWTTLVSRSMCLAPSGKAACCRTSATKSTSAQLSTSLWPTSSHQIPPPGRFSKCRRWASTARSATIRVTLQAQCTGLSTLCPSSTSTMVPSGSCYVRRKFRYARTRTVFMAAITVRTSVLASFHSRGLHKRCGKTFRAQKMVSCTQKM